MTAYKNHFNYFYIFLSIGGLDVNSKSMQRSNSELDMARYHDTGLTNNVDKADDKKKRGRSPFRFVLKLFLSKKKISKSMASSLEYLTYLNFGYMNYRSTSSTLFTE